MKKYLVAAVLVVSFAAPALAEEIYVVFDPASHKCEAMHNIPEGMKSMGKYGSMDEAKKAMASMKECGYNLLSRIGFSGKGLAILPALSFSTPVGFVSSPALPLGARPQVLDPGQPPRVCGRPQPRGAWLPWPLGIQRGPHGATASRRDGAEARRSYCFWERSLDGVKRFSVSPDHGAGRPRAA